MLAILSARFSCSILVKCAENVENSRRIKFDITSYLLVQTLYLCSQIITNEELILIFGRWLRSNPRVVLQLYRGHSAASDCTDYSC